MYQELVLIQFIQVNYSLEFYLQFSEELYFKSSTRFGMHEEKVIPQGCPTF
jgi:hypothetical protein